MSTISQNKLNELSIILSNLYNNCKNEKEVYDLVIDISAKSNYFAQDRLDDIEEENKIE